MHGKGRCLMSICMRLFQSILALCQKCFQCSCLERCCWLQTWNAGVAGSVTYHRAITPGLDLATRSTTPWLGLVACRRVLTWLALTTTLKTNSFDKCGQWIDLTYPAFQSKSDRFSVAHAFIAHSVCTTADIDLLLSTNFPETFLTLNNNLADFSKCCFNDQFCC